MHKFCLLGFSDNDKVFILLHLSLYTHSIRTFLVSSSLVKDVITCSQDDWESGEGNNTLVPSCCIINSLWRENFVGLGLGWFGVFLVSSKIHYSHILVNWLFHIQDYFFFPLNLAKSLTFVADYAHANFLKQNSFKLLKCQKVSEPV